MSLSQALLLSLFGVYSVIAQADLGGLGVCYGDGSICGAYANFDGCPSLNIDPDKYWACYCADSLPLRIACDECQYEYGIMTSWYFNMGYYSSICSSEGHSIGTVPESILASVSSYTATITVSKSATFDSSAMASRTTTKISFTSTGYWYSAWTSTYGPSMDITPLATAPVSVEDNPSDGNGGKAARNMFLVGGAFILGAGLLLG